VDLMRKRGEAKRTFPTTCAFERTIPTRASGLGGPRHPARECALLDVWLGYTPLDAQQRTNRTYGYLSVKKPALPGIIHAVWPFVTWFTENIFREDKEIVEFEQQAYEAQGNDWNNECSRPCAIFAACSRVAAGRCLPEGVVRLACRAIAATLLFAWRASAAPTPDAPAPDAAGAAPNEPSLVSRWLDPSTAPFIPVPLIGSDPNSGTTLGLLPVWLATDDEHEIRRIIAPDVLHNPYFGYGVDARIYEYASKDSQWSIDSGIKERVERDVDAEYQVGRLRNELWSLNYSLIFNRAGTPRFYGMATNRRSSTRPNYTNTQELAQVQVGLNLNHAWQILFNGALSRGRRDRRHADRRQVHRDPLRSHPGRRTNTQDAQSAVPHLRYARRSRGSDPGHGMGRVWRRRRPKRHFERFHVQRGGRRRPRFLADLRRYGARGAHVPALHADFPRSAFLGVSSLAEAPAGGRRTARCADSARDDSTIEIPSRRRWNCAVRCCPSTPSPRASTWNSRPSSISAGSLREPTPIPSNSCITCSASGSRHRQPFVVGKWTLDTAVRALRYSPASIIRSSLHAAWCIIQRTITTSVGCPAASESH